MYDERTPKKISKDEKLVTFYKLYIRIKNTRKCKMELFILYIYINYIIILL